MGGVLGGNSNKSPTLQLFNRCQLPENQSVIMEELPVDLRIKNLFDEDYLAPKPSSGRPNGPQKSNTNLSMQSNDSAKKRKKSNTNLSSG